MPSSATCTRSTPSRADGAQGMRIAPLPANEPARLARLRALAVLDSAPEAIFDSLTRIAAQSCGVAMAFVSLIDERRQCFKSTYGVELSETPREFAFCSHAILDDTLMEVPDAALDDRFADNPMVVGEPGIRFYAGSPIALSGGERVGALCVIDRQPRRLDALQRQLLSELAAAVARTLELRERTLDGTPTARTALPAPGDLHAERAPVEVRERLAAIVQSSGDAIIGTDVDGVIEHWNAAAQRIFQYSAVEVVGRKAAILFAPRGLLDGLRPAVRVFAGEIADHFETVCRRRDGAEVDVSMTLSPIRDEAQHTIGLAWVLRDISALKATERVLRESEAKFRVLCEASPTGVIHTDATGLCTYTNPVARNIFDLSLEQCLGEGWWQTLHPDDHDSVLESWRRAAESGADFAMEFRVLRFDGTQRHVRTHGRSLRDDGGAMSGFVGAVEDITDQLLAQKRLRASEGMLDRVGRVASIGGWTLDLRSRKLTWADQTARIHDLPAGHQATLAEALNFFAPPGRAQVDAEMRRGIERGTSWDLELPLTTAAGRSLWVRVLGEVEWEGDKPVRVYGAVQDVTAWREAQEALQESRHLLRVMYEATPAMLHSMSPDGRMLTVSDVWLQTLGYPRDDVVGQFATRFFAEPSRAPFRDDVLAKLAQRGSVQGVALQMLCNDGGVRDVLLAAVLDRDAEGLPRRALVFIDDVTEDLARRAELQREQSLRRGIERQALDLSELLAERSEMLDVMAHEVRQPLNNASAALQGATLALSGRGQDAAMARLDRARMVIGQVLAGIDNTLAAASLLAGSGHLLRIDTDIDTLIGVTIADIPVPQRARILVERTTMTRTTNVDMGLVRLALRNLLANALKYSPAGSPVKLRIAESDQPLALILEVSDAGAGIGPDLVPRLFERGARGAQGGHGLGLYIASRVMAMHGGRIELARNGPQGSTLRLVIEEGGA